MKRYNFIVAILVLGYSSLFALSEIEKTKYINQINENSKKTGSQVRMYSIDYSSKNKTYHNKYDVPWEYVNDTMIGNLRNHYCTNKGLRRYLNKGYSYNMTYRNAYTKRILTNFLISKRNCR